MKLSSVEWSFVVLAVLGYVLYWFFNILYAGILILPLFIIILNKLSGKKFPESFFYFTTTGLEEDLKNKGEKKQLTFLYIFVSVGVLAILLAVLVGAISS
jgi:ABC-type spermidine/putrescine transport system permease subunit II